MNLKNYWTCKMTVNGNFILPKLETLISNGIKPTIYLGTHL